MTRKQKKTLIRIIVAAVLLVVCELWPTPIYLSQTTLLEVVEFSPPQLWLFRTWTADGMTGYVFNRFIFFLIPYFVIGWDILWKAIRNIGHGQVFDENFLMCVATVGALVLGEYSEAVGVMLF